MKPVLLVHGAWHGSWCWRPVMTALATQGILATTIDLPLTGQADDCRTVAQTLDVLGGDVVLVGHSYGGSVISCAADGRGGLIRQLVELGFRFFRDEERVSPALRSDVEKRVHVLVFVDLVARDLPADDLVEKRGFCRHERGI